MEKALRVLSITSALLWALLAGMVILSMAFVILGEVYVYVDRPVVVVYKGQLEILVVIYVRNGPIFSIRGLHINISLTDLRGHLLCQNETSVGDVGPDSDLTLSFTLRPRIPPWLRGRPLNLTVVANMIYAVMFPIEVRASFKIQPPYGLVGEAYAI